MPLTLAAVLRPFVTSTSRGRGESYFQRGRVSTVPSDPGAFHASVRGTRPYDVSLTLDEDRLVVDCSCPYFQQSIDPCKHIWAAILAADEARVFQVPAELSIDFDDALIDAREVEVDDDYLEQERSTGFLGR